MFGGFNLDNEVHTSQANKGLPPVLLLIAIVVLFYGTFSYGLTWLDKPLVNQTAEMSLSDLQGFLTQEHSWPQQDSTLQYRPLNQILLYLDHMLWGKNTLWYHAENIILHFLVTLLFYRIVLLSFGDIRTAFYSSLLFAIHPIAVEPVSSILARESIICALFIMLSLWALLNARGGKKSWIMFSILAFLLSILSLEHGIILSVFIVAHAFLSRHKTIRANALTVILFLMATASYFYLRTILQVNEPISAAEDVNAGIALSVLYKYFIIVIFPFSLHVAYNFDPIGVFSPQGFIVIFFLTGLIVATVLPRTPEAIRCACLWILVSIIPFIYLIPFVSSPLTDRYVYLALPGFCLLGGWATSALVRQRQYVGILLFSTIIVVLGVTTYKQSIVWKNDFLLWENAVKRSPSNAEAYYNLAKVHDEVGSHLMAISYYKTSLNKKPMYVAPHIGLGNLYKSIGEHDQAFHHYTLSLVLAPQKYWIHLNIGDVLMEKGEWDRALDSYTRYLEHKPDDPNAHYKIAVAYQSKGDYVSSIGHFNEALSSKPRFAKARYDLSRLLVGIDDIHNARQELRLALLIDPNFSEARTLLEEIKQ
jgi:Tfp pilus assembly protein PilF